MPGRVVVVHNSASRLSAIAAELFVAGHDVVPFLDPMRAWDRLSSGGLEINVLVTRVRFSSVQSTGVALAQVAILRHRAQVLFIGRRFDAVSLLAGRVQFLPTGGDITLLVRMVNELLGGRGSQNEPTLN